ncbi:MAG: hypothetical protein AAFN59_00890 [Pseudomonadota bacterium]
MSLFVLSPEVVWNPGILKFPSAPRKILERGMVLPRRDASWGFVARVIFESQLLRFLLTLLPFGLAAIIWPSMALPISSAPIAMLIAIGFVELRLIRIPRHKRAAITTEDAAARTLDTLQFRGRRILGKLAAQKGIQSGSLFLVVEQSDIARLPPLTVASVQMDEGKYRLMALSDEDRRIIREGLFDDTFTERDLLRANLREGISMRSVSFDARGVSAHGRLAAFLDATAPSAEVIS